MRRDRRGTGSATVDPGPPLRLLLDSAALAANWRHVAALGAPAACGAVVKADAFGLGAPEVVARLATAGCRDFYVATWAEAAALDPLPPGATLCVLHGVRTADMSAAAASPARPILGSPEQVARWRSTGRACDVMVDTGMSRLGLTPAQATSGLLDGLCIDTLMSHLACADAPDHPMNARQRAAFVAIAARIPARRRSLANSAGIWLGPAYHFDLTRPGLALYGGTPAPHARGLAPVAAFAAELVQVRHVDAGATVGYGATFTAPAPMRVGVLNLGYADGLLHPLGPATVAHAGATACAIVGRVSMDLTCVDLTHADAREGDWLTLPLDLAAAARATGLLQYEILTGLGRRLERVWR